MLIALSTAAKTKFHEQMSIINSSTRALLTIGEGKGELEIFGMTSNAFLKVSHYFFHPFLLHGALCTLVILFLPFIQINDSLFLLGCLLSMNQPIHLTHNLHNIK